MRKRYTLIIAASITGLAAMLLPAVTVSASDRETTDFVNPHCPRIVSGKVAVKPGNVVELDSKVDTGYDEDGTRITLRNAKTGIVSFATDDVLPYGTKEVESLTYREELPLDAPRQRMILRVTLRHEGCKTVAIDRPFMSRPPRARVAP